MTAPVLAYVFWHAPLGPVAPVEYEAGLRAFHSSLASSPPPGFLASASYRASRTPWEGSRLGPVVYVDWYLVDGWAAMGTLEEGAIAPPHDGAHDSVAVLADHAYGGLYRLRVGPADLSEVRFDGWLGKPRGVPSPAFAEGLVPPDHRGEVSVWQRQLALGPAPEFCRRSRSAPGAPAEGECRVEVRPVVVPSTG